MFSHRSAQQFYDRLGSRQDWQRCYEDAAIDELIKHADLGHTSSLFEFGCGTGRLAQRLLRRELPRTATYLGVDVSTIMVRLASARLTAFGHRAQVRLSDGNMALNVETGSCDRFLSAYVLDLLADTDIHELISEAHRILVTGGELELASLAGGDTLAARWISNSIAWLQHRRPSLTGGCRPLVLEKYLPASQWDIVCSAKITRFLITSQILVARKAAT